MPQAIHIFRKDLHRLRWAVIGWCAIVASRTVLATAGPDISLRTAEMELAVDHLSDMLGLVYVLLHFVLVSRLVHDEPLVGRNAFWITRPIAPGALMAAKLGFVGLFFLSVPLAGSIIIAGWFGTDARGIAHTIPVFLLNHLVLTTIMLVFAHQPEHSGPVHVLTVGGRRGFVFEQNEMGFPARATNVAWIDLSEDWFGGAELEVLEFVGAGSVTRTVTVDHFKMTP
jgi:hypothetical protein